MAFEKYEAGQAAPGLSRRKVTFQWQWGAEHGGLQDQVSVAESGGGHSAARAVCAVRGAGVGPATPRPRRRATGRSGRGPFPAGRGPRPGVRSQ